MLSVGQAGSQIGWNAAQRQSQIGGNAAQPQSQVSEMAIRQEQAAKYLHEQLGVLEDRLSAILRASAPTPSTQTKEQRELVTHAARLADVAELIEAASSRIQELLSRVEL